MQLEPLLVHPDDMSVLRPLARHVSRHHDADLMLVRIQLVSQRIEPLDAVPLKRSHEDRLRQLEAFVQRDEVVQVLGPFVRRLVCHALDLVVGHAGERAVEVVDRVGQVRSELLDGQVARAFLVALGAVLEVFELGELAEVLVLFGGQNVSFCFWYRSFVHSQELKTNLQLYNLLLLIFQLLPKLHHFPIFLCFLLWFFRLLRLFGLRGTLRLRFRGIKPHASYPLRKGRRTYPRLCGDPAAKQ
jgi:hypothetical protein